MNISKAGTIAKKKGFTLSFFDDEEIYVLQDKRDGFVLMTYAPVTMNLMNENTWREECNKMKRNADK